MSRHSSHHSRNESSENKSDLRKILNEIRYLKIKTEVHCLVSRPLVLQEISIDVPHYFASIPNCSPLFFTHLDVFHRLYLMFDAFNRFKFFIST